MDFLAVLLLIVVIIGGFVVVPAWVSKKTGMNIKSKHGGTFATPNDLDRLKKDTKNVADKTKGELTKKTNLLSKQIKGTYKYLFDKINNLTLIENDGSKSLGHLIRLKKSIEIRQEKINSEHEKSYLPDSFKSNHPEFYSLKTEIDKYKEYLNFIDKTDFKKYVELIAKITDTEPNVGISFIDKIGIENSNKVYTLLKEIDDGFWRNDLTEQETEKLNKVVYRKIFEPKSTVYNIELS